MNGCKIFCIHMCTASILCPLGKRMVGFKLQKINYLVARSGLPRLPALHHRKQRTQQQKRTDSGKKHQRHPYSRFPIDFGNQIGCCYVKRHTR